MINEWLDDSLPKGLSRITWTLDGRVSLTHWSFSFVLLVVFGTINEVDGGSGSCATTDTVVGLFSNEFVENSWLGLLYERFSKKFGRWESMATAGSNLREKRLWEEKLQGGTY